MASTSPMGDPPAQLHGFARLWRTLKQLFHELVGAVFAVLAFAWVQSAIRAWTRDGARWLVATAFVVAAEVGGLWFSRVFAGPPRRRTAPPERAANMASSHNSHDFEP